MAKHLIYTGVGARKTPENILILMKQLAVKLDQDGYYLRSGGAKGADSAFESGTNNKHVYLAKHANAKAEEIAKQFHPAWDKCSDFAKKLHARNAFQVLGFNLDAPSNFLICWTPDGCFDHANRTYATGGTGTAISIACRYNVPVFNLKNNVHFERLNEYVKGG
jgi:hypothetical protein